LANERRERLKKTNWSLDDEPDSKVIEAGLSALEHVENKMKKRSPPSKKALKKIQRIQDAARKKDAEDVRKVNKQLKTGNTAAKRGRPKGSKNKGNQKVYQ